MFGGMPPMGMMGPGPSNMGYQNMRNFPPYGMVGCVQFISELNELQMYASLNKSVAVQSNKLL